MKAAKLSGKVLAAACKKVFAEIAKQQEAAKRPKGRQSVRKLMNHHGGKNAMKYVGAPKDFDRIAKEFHVDYAFHKTGPGHYLLFFKADQADAIQAAFGKYTEKVMGRSQDRPSILGQLRQFVEQIAARPKQKEQVRKAVKEERYYPFYNMDVYLEVSDEIAGQLDRFKLDEEAHRVRVLRAKAYFSLDRGDGIEKDALQKPPQPLELILKAEQVAHLDAALRALSDCQRRRILAFYLDGESKAKIAKRENVNESAVRKSIRTGLTALKKFLNAE